VKSPFQDGGAPVLWGRRGRAGAPGALHGGLEGVERVLGGTHAGFVSAGPIPRGQGRPGPDAGGRRRPSIHGRPDRDRGGERGGTPERLPFLPPLVIPWEAYRCGEDLESSPFETDGNCSRSSSSASARPSVPPQRSSPPKSRPQNRFGNNPRRFSGTAIRFPPRADALHQSPRGPARRADQELGLRNPPEPGRGASRN